MKAQELLDLLRKIRSLTEQINSVLPPEFQGGLSSVIGVLNKLDEIITSVLADFETTLPTFKTIRDLANSVAEGLNQEVGPFQIGLEGTTLFVTFTIDDVTFLQHQPRFAGLGATLNDLRVTLINLQADPAGTEFSISNALSFEISEVADINLFDAPLTAAPSSRQAARFSTSTRPTRPTTSRTRSCSPSGSTSTRTWASRTRRTSCGSAPRASRSRSRTALSRSASSRRLSPPHPPPTRGAG